MTSAILLCRHSGNRQWQPRRHGGLLPSAGDRRLLNVGLSRAKRLVVIVGALDTLAAGEHGEMGWRQLVQHVREHGVLLDVCQPNMADLTGQLEQIVQAANGVGSQATVVADSSQEAGSVTPTRNVRQRTE